jgi:hypothetical protein
MTSLRKRSWLAWDVGIGIVLLVCGLMLALWDRVQPAPTSESSDRAAIRAPDRLQK